MFKSAIRTYILTVTIILMALFVCSQAWAITFRIAQQSYWTTATNSPVVAKPAGTADNDLILVYFVTNTTTTTETSIAGFTRIGNEVDISADATCAVYYKIASSELSSWTFTNLFNSTERGMAVVVVYYNIDTANPINAYAQSSVTSTAVSGPSITPAAGNSLIVQFVGADPGTATYSATPDSSPVATERFDAKDGSGSSYAYAAVQEYQQGTAATIALDYTGLYGDTYGYHQIAISPLVNPPNYHECFTKLDTDGGCTFATCITGNINYCYNDTCGSAPCWTASAGSGSIDPNYNVTGEERLRVTATSTTATQTYLTHSSAAVETYMSVWMKIVSTGTLATGAANMRVLAYGADAAGGYAVGMVLNNDVSTGYTLKFLYYSAGTNNIVSALPVSTYNWVGKWIQIKLRYNAVVGADNTGYEIYDAYGKLLVSNSYALASTIRAGIQRYGLGFAYTTAITGTAEAIFDDLNVKGDAWVTVPEFSFGTCGDLTGAHSTTNYTSSNCGASDGVWACPSGSHFEGWSAGTYNLTRYNSTTGLEDQCGTDGAVPNPFPYSADGPPLFWNNYDKEQWDMYSPTNTAITTKVIDYVQSESTDAGAGCTLGTGCGHHRLVDIANSSFFNDYSRVVKNGTSEKLQLINLLRMGTNEIKNDLYGSSGSSVAVGSATTNKYFAQKFTAGSAYTLNGVWIGFAAPTGSPTMNMKVDLYSHSVGTGKPDVSLASSNWRSASQATAGGYYFFDLNYTLTNGVSYWIVLHTDAVNSSNYIRWNYVSSTGEGWCNGDGSTWTTPGTASYMSLKTIQANSGNGLATIILPPYFNTARSTRYPLVLTGIGSWDTVNNSLYNGTSHQMLLDMITNSYTGDDGDCTASGNPWVCCTGLDTGTCKSGVIGVIINGGGGYSQGNDPEWYNALAELMAKLYTDWYADTSKVAFYGFSKGGGMALINGGWGADATTEFGACNGVLTKCGWTTTGMFATSAPAAIGSSLMGEDTLFPAHDNYYLPYTSWLTYRNSTVAYTTALYHSILPPHCTSISTCGPNYLALGMPLGGSTVRSEIDAASAVGLCDTTANCHTHFGNDDKYIVLSSGTHDATVPFLNLLVMSEKLRDATIDHRRCITFRGGHTGEAAICVKKGIKEYVVGTNTVSNCLACVNNPTDPCSLPTPPNDTQYWQADTITHDPNLTMQYATGESVDLPFITNIPTVLVNQVYNSGTGSPYIGYQQPAQLLVAGKEGDTWLIEMLSAFCSVTIATPCDEDSDCPAGETCGHSIADQDPPKIWNGTFGTNSCGSGCICLLYGDEWCLIGSSTPGSGVQFECVSPPCLYFWKFMFNELTVNSSQTPYYGKEAYTCVKANTANGHGYCSGLATKYCYVDGDCTGYGTCTVGSANWNGNYQPDDKDMYLEISGTTYCTTPSGGESALHLNFGIAQNPSCGDRICQDFPGSNWEDTENCPTGNCSTTTTTICLRDSGCPGGETCVIAGGDCPQRPYWIWGEDKTEVSE